MVCREKEKEENLLGKENVWFAEKTKNEKEKEENIRKRKMSLSVTDIRNCGDRARILD